MTLFLIWKKCFISINKEDIKKCSTYFRSIHKGSFVWDYCLPTERNRLPLYRGELYKVKLWQIMNMLSCHRAGFYANAYGYIFHWHWYAVNIYLLLLDRVETIKVILAGLNITQIYMYMIHVTIMTSLNTVLMILNHVINKQILISNMYLPFFRSWRARLPRS